MSDFLSTPCTAFAGIRRVAQGPLVDVALAIKAKEGETQGPVLVFQDASGAVVDLDLRGSTAEIVSRLTAQGELLEARGVPANRTRGRPKLGVVAREVTLLPRHWEWLARQPGGASQALRRLVDEARRADGGQTDRRAAQERSYRFLSALAGDLPGYEEAIRALFAGESAAFAARMAAWPPEVRSYAMELATLRPPEK